MTTSNTKLGEQVATLLDESARLRTAVSELRDEVAVLRSDLNRTQEAVSVDMRRVLETISEGRSFA